MALYEQDNYADVVIIGRGYTAATLTMMADLSWAQKLVIVGGPDPWEQIVRGRGLVNHPQYLTARRLTATGTALPDPGSRDRLRDENAALQENLRQRRKRKGLSTRFIKGNVAQITLAQTLSVSKRNRAKDEIPDAVKAKLFAAAAPADPQHQTPDTLPVPIFEVSTPKGNFLTPKILYCGGAGPHKVPEDLGLSGFGDKKYFLTEGVAPPELGLERFMDMDQFMRMYGGLSIPSPDLLKNRDRWLKERDAIAALKTTDAMQANLRQEQLLEEQRTVFKRDYESKAQDLTGKTILLMGPNAGVDAACAVLNSGADLIWMNGTVKDLPFWLSSFHYIVWHKQSGSWLMGEDVVAEDPQRPIYPLTRYVRNGYESNQKTFGVKITDVSEEDGVRYDYIQLRPDGTAGLEQTGQKADFLVYAVGQDPGRGTGPLQVLRPVLTADPALRLKPIPDINHRFPTLMKDGTPVVDGQGRQKFDTPLGLSTDPWNPVSGIDVYGAAAWALLNTRSSADVMASDMSTGGVRSAYLAITDAIRLGTVVTGDQLNVIRAQISAATGFDLRREMLRTNDLLRGVSDVAEQAATTWRIGQEAVAPATLLLSVKNLAEAPTDRPRPALVVQTLNRVDGELKLSAPSDVSDGTQEGNQFTEEQIEKKCARIQSRLRRAVKQIQNHIAQGKADSDLDARLDPMRQLMVSVAESAVNPLSPADLAVQVFLFQEATVRLVAIVASRLELNRADATELMIQLASAFPHLPDPVLQPLAEALVKNRHLERGGKDLRPVGYTDVEQRWIMSTLQKLDADLHADDGKFFAAYQKHMKNAEDEKQKADTMVSTLLANLIGNLEKRA